MIFKTTKHTLLLISFFIFSSLFAQQDAYKLKDSVNVRNRDKMRQWSYENNLSSYSPKKKNNWSLGLKGGHSFISGDVTPLPGWTAGIDIRKALGHVFSIRMDANAGQSWGQDWKRNGAYEYNPAWNGINNGVTYNDLDYVYQNHKTNYFDVGIQGVFSFNNIHFYKKETKLSVYGFAGIGIIAYKTSVDAVDENNLIYDFGSIQQATALNQQREIRKMLRDLMDQNYETLGDQQAFNYNLNDYVLKPNTMVGLGISYKVSRRVELSIEHNINFAFDDLLDGHRWREVTENVNITTNSLDVLNKTTFGISFRIGKGEDALWWSNPMNKVFNRIRSIDRDISKFTKDSDGDGVVDGVDKDNKTPKGVLVDTHGVPLDSDGDGVFDHLDAEPHSPKSAQVDKQGVALDTDQDGVPDLYDLELRSPAGASVDPKGRTLQIGGSGVQAPSAAETSLPSIRFDLASAEIKSEAVVDLISVAKFIRNRPGIVVKVIGHADTRNQLKQNENLSKRRAETVKTFLVDELGIDASRLEVEYFGDSQPIFKNLPDTKQARVELLQSMNRRVEFLIKE